MHTEKHLAALKMAEQNRLILPEEKEVIRLVDALEAVHPPKGVYEEMELALVGSVISKPYSANCSRQFSARHYSGLRPLDQIWQHIIHDQESSTARAAASWFENLNSAGSATYCNDDNECYRTLNDNQVPWGAPGANYHGLHYEQAGFASWTRLLWSARHRKTMLRTAWKVARDLRKYGNPPIWLNVSALRADQRGVSDHATCTAAFGGSHTDPGPNYPRRIFMGMVRTYYNDLIHVRRIA